MNIDRLCQTCGGTGKRWNGNEWERFPCPHCTDGLVPFIALAKQGGRWPSTFMDHWKHDALAEWTAEEILDALAAIPEGDTDALR